MFGVDYSYSRLNLSGLKAGGVGFVCRYLSNDPTKNLTLAEAKVLTSGDISIVANWETTSTMAERGFPGGQADARAALTQAVACGMPLGRPIYFSVDEDTTVGPNITGYFQGVRSVLPISQIGVYGDFTVVSQCNDLVLASWFWQTYAWSYSRWFTGAHIRQYLNGQKLGGMDVDYDASMFTDFGQWSLAPVNQPSSTHPIDPLDPNYMRMVRFCQRVLRAAEDGIWGPDTERRGELVRQAGLHGPTAIDVKALQKDVLGFTGSSVDGLVGSKTLAGWSAVCRGLQTGMFVHVDGVWGHQTDEGYKILSPYV
jgi:hypothetical protein